MRLLTVHVIAPLVTLGAISYYGEYSVSFLSALITVNALFVVYMAVHIPGASSTPAAVAVCNAVVRELFTILAAVMSNGRPRAAATTPLIIHEAHAEIEINDQGQKYVLFVPYSAPRRDTKKNKTWIVKGDKRKQIHHYPGIPILVRPEDIQCDRIEITDIRNRVITTVKARKNET